MEQKYVIIAIIIIVVVLFLHNKSEHMNPTQLSNEAIQNISSVYANTTGTATFNNLKANGAVTMSGRTEIGGYSTFTNAVNFRGMGTDTWFPYTDGRNYIRGPTNVDGDTTFTNVTRFKGAGTNSSTHFPWSDGKNYIRGTTQVDGDLYANQTLYYNKIKTGNAEQRPGTRGGGGGGGFNLYCPEGTVMVGLTGGAGRLVDRVGPICK